MSSSTFSTGKLSQCSLLVKSVEGFPDLKSSWSESYYVPCYGNGFITQKGIHYADISAKITPEGLKNWIHTDTIMKVFFRAKAVKAIKVGVRIRIPGKNVSTLKATFHDRSLNFISSSINFEFVEIGEYRLPKLASDGSYLSLTFEGVAKTGELIADLTHVFILPVEFEAGSDIFCVRHDPYFGARGPSIHLKYVLPDTGEIPVEYFYNEIEVPKHQDVLGAYFCAIGFEGGYLGIQVNSVQPESRRVIFSVWSEYNTDDPEAIPEEYKVRVVKKGSRTHIGEFGNEGAGAQSFVIHNWKTETKYGFVMHAVPNSSNSTLFTAWFREGNGQWYHIATFHRPKKATYLVGPYSFSENFLIETGHVARKAYFGNQHFKPLRGKWEEVFVAKFTGDATSKKDRKDYSCGVEQSKFYLQNCGFFDNMVETGSSFTRCNCQQEPFDLDVMILPR